MKIKKLEILGFKSFIDKSTLTFPRGITAVVGPNGSGKSNIVDAIKWALGEQSVKSLRGKAMEDVIFNGSGDKKPLGMAEVTLTFTHADGIVPPNFSTYHEITVRRRIYRSGESEYFLNKAPCRLKDINGLFMGTGVGAKTYSIIAQGQIGSIISARPEERRVFVEEAAGITKYKAKKIEAIRKIESTRNNLLRIGDIIGEVKRQMDSLAQQAKRAEDYKELKENLKKSELMDAAKGYLRLTEEIEAEQKRLKGKEEEEAVAEARLLVVEGKIEEMKTSSMEVEEQFSQIQRSFFSNEAEIKTVEESIRHLKDRIESTRRRNESLDGERGELEGFITETSGRIEGLEGRIRSSREEAESLRSNLNEIEGRLSDVTAVVDDLAARGDELQKQRLFEASRISELRNGIDSTGRLIARFTGMIEERAGELNSLKAEITRLNDLVDGRSSERDRVEAEVKDCSGRLSDLDLKIEGLTKRESEVLREREEAGSKLARANSKLAILLEMEKNYEGLSEGVKGIMTGKGEGVIGIFSDFIETDEGHEKALEGYLGEAVSAVVVRGLEDARRQIDRLKSDGSGRAVFIPMENINGRGGGASLSGNGVLGRLRESVKVKGEGGMGNILSFFGDAHLVDTLESALRVWEEKKPDFSLVTLDGELVTPEGLIFGGSREGGFSVFKNRREREGLEKDVIGLERGLINIEENLNTTRDELSSAKADFKREEKGLSDLKMKSQTLKTELDASIKDRTRVEKAVTETEAAVRKESDEIERLKSEREESVKELESAGKREDGLKADDEALRSELQEKRKVMREVEEEETEAKLSLNKAIDLKEHLSESLEELKRQIERAERDRDNKARGISDGEAEIEDFTRKISESERELSEKIMASKELEDKLRDARAEVDGGLSREKELENERKKAQGELAKVREGLQQKRDEIRELAWELERLTANTKERYNEEIGETYMNYVSEKIDDVDLKEEIDRLKKRIDKFGEVNLLAISEYNSRMERYEFLKSQESDLLDSIDSLNKTIKKIDKKSRERFLNTFNEINEKFGEVFPRLVPGGKARIVLTDKDDPLESGVEIMAQPPDKRLSSITLLSGGEKALTAIALIFSIFLIKPTPFCMMDEVDAPLDDINIERFIDLLKEISLTSQVILITHNKKTMEMADTLYGITMEDPGVSKMVSVKLTDHEGLSVVS
ncbi:MAG: chromosome segregation protein SMC [Deltaproteobacteria bacterium]|uniref:Chromosome partition protein Smc n=1 Tax=Candidatus Zymogenus saltonus TaxID=2844893 RepID=A0A9D8PKL3_9DELT|nr:chromosome segregation protein SMC [Candidatus Zymogenus saltonus]